jgi:glycosyltransferase involved in cell wall biosynthesis
MPAVAARHPGVRFLFLGKGPLKVRLESECRRQGVRDRVIFAGFRRDIHRILPCLDLVVHPARMEGLGVSLLQAAACGVPIVASRAGGIPETVQDGENGLLVTPGDKRALEGAILKLMAEPERRRRMGEAGRRLVSERFSIQRMVAENARIYQGVLGWQ